MLPTLRKSGQRAFGTTAASIKYAPPTLESVGKSSFPNLRMVLLGAPGSGKGSFAKFISHYYNVPVLSTGDLIRKEIADNSPIGRAVKEASNSGKLLGDDVVIEVLKNALSKATSSSPSGTPPNGYILDGFPRRISQAVSLEQMNGAVNAASGTAASAAASSSASAHAQGGASLPPINVALNINLREDVLVRKAVARRVCKGCGRGYNVADIQEDNICMPAILPRRTGVCDSVRCFDTAVIQELTLLFGLCPSCYMIKKQLEDALIACLTVLSSSPSPLPPSPSCGSPPTVHACSATASSSPGSTTPRPPSARGLPSTTPSQSRWRPFTGTVVCW